MDKTLKVLFMHTFHVYQPRVGEDWYIFLIKFMRSTYRSFLFGNAILGIDDTSNCHELPLSSYEPVILEKDNIYMLENGM